MNTKQVKDTYVDKAISILRGKDVRQALSAEVETLHRNGKPVTGADLLLGLAVQLMGVKEFGYARRILARARPIVDASDAKLKLKMYQKSAVSTYKDPDLPAERRLNDALDILKQVENLATTKNQETLGIAGAIYKRKWEVDNQTQNLEIALRFYQRGREQGVAGDQGYTAINEAYLLDLLASLETQEAQAANKVAPEAGKMCAEAQKIREEIIEKVPPLAEQPDGEWLKREWWYYSTVGEAYFGLQDYPQAAEWLVDRKPTDLEVPDWEYESTARQLAALARVQYGTDIPEDEFEKTGAGWALKKLLGDDNVEAVRSAFVGKIGLALSGGGFRASLFHIGVLARLAELDLLRRVEVLSCVSGGSIIGAHYYLEVRRLLESQPDHTITKKDYIEIIKRLEEDFLTGVQRNVRTRVATSWLTNLKMVFKPRYSRTLRAGELYESELFSKVTYRSPEEKGKARWLNDLRIKPALASGGRQDDFNPKYHNWKRGAKAPILILNATTLNTGHSWHFTVTYMGEPPRSIDTEIDGNYRLRRMYYADAPAKPTDHQKVRLGHAVAASACVPGLFEPLALDDLYENAEVQANGTAGKKRPAEELRVRLVDGGVCDNQGVMGLIEQECSVMLVSDASGQMEPQATPGSGLLNVPLRTSSVLQARVRGAQYRDLRERHRSGLLRGLMFVHLKQDLGVRPLNWRNVPAHLKVSDFDSSEQHAGDVTSYGVAKDVQGSLAAIRTDLDSFCDVEADALMASAYLMTKRQLDKKDSAEKESIEGIRLAGVEEPWRFRRIETYLKPAQGAQSGDEVGRAREKRKEDLKNIIGASSSLAFKIWKLSPMLKVLSWMCVIALVVLVGWGVLSLFGVSPLTTASVNYLVRLLTPERIDRLGRVLTVGNLFLAALAVLVALFTINFIGKKYLGVMRWSDTLTSIAIGIVMTCFGFIAAWIHLQVFDRLYLWWGSRDRFYNGQSTDRKCKSAFHAPLASVPPPESPSAPTPGAQSRGASTSGWC